jgi:hypothetical protein
MIRHVVLLKWNEGVDEAHIVATKAALDRLPSVIPEILAFPNGPDVHAVPGNHDYVVTADFATIDDFFIYRGHPEHQKFVAAFLTDHCQRVAAQFNVD